MNRFTAFLLSALLGAVVTAAPAPPPRVSGPWFTGWDKPVDPLGDCQFERSGDRLTITVPGQGHGIEVEKGKLNAPHLLRDAQGEFVVQVRISGDFRQAKLAAGLRRAGFLVTDGKNNLMRYARSNEGSWPVYAGTHILGWRGGGQSYNKGPALDQPGYLRLERRLEVNRLGQRYTHLRMFHSLDGKTWTPSGTREVGLLLPEKVKVGVFAEATAEGSFKPVFDQFKLTPLGAAAQ